MLIDFELNGEEVQVEASGTERLLDILRERFGLTGVKEGCGEGECGACVVLMDEKLVNSCIVPLANVTGHAIITIEGLKKSGKHFESISQAFIEAGAVQCGFCTPGFVMATEALLNENPSPDREKIKEYFSGNLCRCTGYNMIIEAVERASKARLNE
jgi:aerobic carbon-monoxide dehydrogenase small subunit